jgi:hypothetical protein
MCSNHVKSYVIKVIIIEEVGLELVSSSNHYGYPYYNPARRTVTRHRFVNYRHPLLTDVKLPYKSLLPHYYIYTNTLSFLFTWRISFVISQIFVSLVGYRFQKLT